MEDISHSDVQFDDEKWVQGRKTKRTIWQLVPVEMSLRTAVEVQEDAVERMWTMSTNSECVKCCQINDMSNSSQPVGRLW